MVAPRGSWFTVQSYPQYRPKPFKVQKQPYVDATKTRCSEKFENFQWKSVSVKLQAGIFRPYFHLKRLWFVPSENDPF